MAGKTAYSHNVIHRLSTMNMPIHVLCTSIFVSERARKTGWVCLTAGRHDDDGISGYAVLDRGVLKNVYVYICGCAEGRWDGAWNPHSAALSGKHLGLLSKQPCAVLHGCPCKQFGILERHWSYSMWPVQGYAVYICVHHIQYPAANSLCCYFIHCLCCYMSSKLLKCLNAQMVSH